MIFRNHKKKNQYKETIDKFSDENRLVSFGVIKNFISNKYRWLASYVFKHKNNTQTNKHRAFIGWFGEKENLLNEYGNIPSYSTHPFFEQERPKFPKFYNELSSRQYRMIGQEHAEYDKIEHVDISGKIVIPFAEIGVKNTFGVYHKFGDIPAFVTAGYRLQDRYIRENQQNEVNIKFNNVQIVLNDSQDDILSNPLVLDYLSDNSRGVVFNLIINEQSNIDGDGSAKLYGEALVSVENSDEKIYRLTRIGSRDFNHATEGVAIYIESEIDPVYVYAIITKDDVLVYDAGDMLADYLTDPIMFSFTPV